MVAQPLQGLDGPLALTVLLLRLEVIIALLIRERPLSEQMIDDHQDVVCHRHRGFLPTQARFEPSERAAKVGGRFPGRPRTWHQDPSEVALPLARPSLAPLARTLVMAGIHPGPGGQPGGRLETAHVHPYRGEDLPRRGGAHTRNTLQLLHLGRERRDEDTDRLIELDNLTIEDINEIETEGDELGVVVRKLAGESQLERRQFLA
jgi:hypothetical protein